VASTTAGTSTARLPGSSSCLAAGAPPASGEELAIPWSPVLGTAVICGIVGGIDFAGLLVSSVVAGVAGVLAIIGSVI
jgi:hypothetical protein